MLLVVDPATGDTFYTGPLEAGIRLAQKDRIVSAAYNGTYDCWRKAVHKGEHRHYRKSRNHTGYLAWQGPYDELIGHFINF